MATFNERLLELQGAGSVWQAIAQSAPAQMEGLDNLHEALIRYAWADGDVTRDTVVKLIGRNHGGGSEEWNWERGVPEPLRVEAKYLSGRTAGNWANVAKAAQAAAIENFCNAVYQDAVPGAQDIREFSVAPTAPDMVKVSGWFHVNSNADWERQSWYVRLLNINANPVTVSDVEFQRAYDEAPSA